MLEPLRNTVNRKLPQGPVLVLILWAAASVLLGHHFSIVGGPPPFASEIFRALFCLSRLRIRSQQRLAQSSRTPDAPAVTREAEEDWR